MMALTIEVLKDKHKLTDVQLNREIGHGELFYVAGKFGGWTQYVGTPGLGLSLGEQVDIRDNTTLDTNRLRMNKALKMWRLNNPHAATFRHLLDILLELSTQGDVVQDICKYLSEYHNYVCI